MSALSFFSADEIDQMKGGLLAPPPPNYKLPTRFPDISKAATISIDLESFDPNIGEKGPGCRRKDGYIVGYGVAAWDKDGKEIYAEYLPTRHRVGQNLDEANVIKYLQDNLNYFEGELLGANVILYDGDWLQTNGIRPRYAKWRDIQWAEALIDETAMNYKLDTIAKKYLGEGKVTQRLKELYGPKYIEFFRDVHPGHAEAYGIGDIRLPYAILKEQRKEMERLGLNDLFNLESRLAPILLYMRENGVRIDPSRASNLQHHLEDKRQASLKDASQLSGVELTTENFGRPSVVAYALDKLGIEYPTTETGRPSIKDKWLERLEHPFGKALATANKCDKAKETFVDGYIMDYAINERIHAEFHPLRRSDENGERGTESGRFSSTHPNLQNIPTRDEEIGPLCRAMFIPEPGMEWYAVDYSQIEYRMLCHFAVANKCKGAEMAQAMYIENPDTDFHEAVAKLTGLKRKDAKNLNFGLVYGMGELHLADSLGLLGPDGKPLPKAKEIMETYHSRAPFIKQLYKMIGETAAKDGEVRTILNRRSQFEMYEPRYTPKDEKTGKMKHVPAKPYEQAIEEYGFDIKRSMTHKALNRKLQGSAADLMKLAMVTAWEAGVFTSTADFTASITVHDELDGSIAPTKRGKECFEELQHIMQTCLPLNVPVLVGADTGSDWSDAK